VTLDPALAVEPTAASTDAAEPASDAEDVPAGADTPGEKRSGRRSSRAQADAERIAELERRLAERDPEKIRADVEAELANQREQQALDAQEASDAERYRRLLETPDAELSGEDYQWREERKQLLAAYPRARKLSADLLEAERRSLAADFEGRREAFISNLAGQLERTASKPGVDADFVRKTADLGLIGDHLWEAGARSRDAEVERLRAELAEHKLAGLGSARTGLAGGGSAVGAPPVDEADVMNGLIRQIAGVA
jgi:hypothetical protein